MKNYQNHCIIMFLIYNIYPWKCIHSRKAKHNFNLFCVQMSLYILSVSNIMHAWSQSLNLLQQLKSCNTVESAFKTHLCSATGYYHHLLFKLQCEYSLKLEGVVDVFHVPEPRNRKIISYFCFIEFININTNKHCWLLWTVFFSSKKKKKSVCVFAI